MKIDLYGDGIGCVELVQHLGSDKTVCHAARVSFGKDVRESQELDSKDKRLIAYLKKHRHSSPFEHCSVTYRIITPLFAAIHHLRHRTWSFNMLSRRYTSENIRFYTPETCLVPDPANKQGSVESSAPLHVYLEVEGTGLAYPYPALKAIREHAEDSIVLYSRLVDSGMSREQARMVLPQNLYTEYYATANLLNIQKFISLREAPDSQYEIREVAKAVRLIAESLFPESMK